jgi:pimeloyl-ACP methyl ester carboxylesterase
MPNVSPTVVLVHGAWADGSSWAKVIPLLLSQGMLVSAAQLPLTSIEEDAAVAKRIIDDVEGPVILVAHSWGGMAVTQAGGDSKVSALVYISAFAPEVGESGSSLIAAHPTPPALSTTITDKAGFVRQTRDGFLKNVAPDLQVTDAEVLAATQGPLAGKAFNDSVSTAAWKTKPSWFIVTLDDRVVHPELQAAEAKRMGAKTTLLRSSSHMSILSHPKEVAAVIGEAAASIEARR